MRSSAVLFVLLAISLRAAAQQPASAPAQTKADAALETETVESSRPAPATPAASQAGEGLMDPAQVKELLHKIWLAEYRLNDLFTEVHPERWKLADPARSSFQQTFETLRSQLKALEEWRSRLDARPDSMYLGYMTYATIDAALPRLDAVTRMISQRENTSLGAQFSQAGNQLFDLQQTLQPYLMYLLRSQDQLLRASQANLAACQNQLSFAMRGRAQRVTPMRNIRPNFKGRRRPKPEGSEKAGAAATAGTGVRKP
jgi:hypothetical protein